MSESDPAAHRGMLEFALTEAEREFRQIRRWIIPRDSHPFGDDVDKFASQLRDLVDKVQRTVRAIRSDMRKEGGLDRAWDRYAELQRDQLPRLANELLAVIGGSFLAKNNLDDMRPLDEGFRPTGEYVREELSFSGIARNLLDELSQRANKLQGSLLIVGEERQVPDGADIVRLRFPACDIWNLPFTAHEYGYLVAQSRQAPDIFDRLKTQVENDVDPSGHRGREPDGADCYLPEVRRLWEAYGNPEGDDEGLPPPREEDTHELQKLRELRARQVAHLCRLFADAFATYFVGPAYVHALLRLRFRPDWSLREPSRNVPAFTDRFVFAFETLRRMDEEDDQLYSAHDFTSLSLLSPFAREVDKQNKHASGLMNDWRRALDDAGERDTYDEAAGRLEGWIETVWESLLTIPAWQGTDERPTVYRYWREACRLEKTLLTGQLPIDARPHPWAVVNAAWSARTQNDESIAKGQGDESFARRIETTALRLLDHRDTDAVSSDSKQKPSETDPGKRAGAQRARARDTDSWQRPSETDSGERAGAQRARARDIDVVHGALSYSDMLYQFRSDVDQAEGGRLPYTPEILKELVGQPGAAAAYKRLCRMPPDTGVAP